MTAYSGAFSLSTRDAVAEATAKLMGEAAPGAAVVRRGGLLPLKRVRRLPQRLPEAFLGKRGDRKARHHRLLSPQARRTTAVDRPEFGVSHPRPRSPEAMPRACSRFFVASLPRRVPRNKLRQHRPANGLTLERRLNRPLATTCAAVSRKRTIKKFRPISMQRSMKAAFPIRRCEASEKLEFERRMPWFPSPDPLALEQRRNLEAALDREVPEWRQINNSPGWLGWLSGTHLYSDRARQFHLDDAVASGNVHRVAQFFKDFIAQRNATQPRPAPPPPQWGSRASPRDRPIYSRADITAASRAYMKGAYRGREAEYEALQADIIRAAREGRIRDDPVS